MSKYVYSEEVREVLDYIQGKLGLIADVAGGQLRVAMHGGETADTDICILGSHSDISRLCTFFGRVPENCSKYRVEYGNLQGYLADWRIGVCEDINLVLYNEDIFDSIPMLVQSFDVSINMYYLDEHQVIHNADPSFDGKRIKLTPYYGTDRSVGCPPKAARVARFIREYPQFDWTDVVEEPFVGVHDFEN